MAALSATSLNAQDVRALLREDPSRASNIHHHYEVGNCIDTPAPKGFKPFYVSHYGRHGCRFHTSERPYEQTVPVLDSLEKKGLLSETGKAFAADIRELALMHSQVAGVLTDRGAAEHQGIAERLYKRVPGVFRNPARKEVNSESTPVPRCIQSMANFCMSLTRNQKNLQISMHTGERYKMYLCKPFPSRNSAEYNPYYSVDHDIINARQDSLMVDTEFFCTMLTDTSAAFQWLGSERKGLMYRLIHAGAIANCLDGDAPDIYKYLSEDQIYNFWMAYNLMWYADMPDIVDRDGMRARYVAEPLLAEMIEKADAAIKDDSKRCADLRFGHDSAVAPLLSLMQVEGYNVTCSVKDIKEEWVGFQLLPMGSNIQMIFYRNKAGEVLVKLIRNENETVIPALPTFQGPYYRWEDLRAYFIDRINANI